MLFRKQNTAKSKVNESTVQDKMANGIARFLLSVQNRFATFMSKNINGLSMKKKQLFLGLFCAVFIGCSIYAFADAFKPLKKVESYFMPSRSSVKMFNGGTPDYFPQAAVSKTEMFRINRFRTYMDSLNHSDTGKFVYDSILKARPGLMDSISTIEEIYYSQSK